MKETGTVISVKGNSVTVKVKRKAACSGCGRCGGRLSLGGDSMIVEAVKIGDPKPGDLVELELPDTDYLRVSFLVYGLPLLSAGAGYGGGWFLGKMLGNASVWAWVFALGGLAVSFAWLRNYDISCSAVGKYKPFAKPLQED